MNKQKIKIMSCILGLAAVVSVLVPQNVFAGEWKRNSIGWWYQQDNGAYPFSGWMQIDGKWYCFDSRGYMRTGWVNGEGNWYYLSEDGSLAVNRWIDGTYYVGNDGKMMANTTTPDGYQVGADGKWTGIGGSSETKHYADEELLAKIQSAVQTEMISDPFIADFNGDGQNEMVVRTRSEIQSDTSPWIAYYLYTDGENLYRFGDYSIYGWIYGTDYLLIPRAGGYDLAINDSARPMAYGGRMPMAYIYRLGETGATELYSAGLCELDNPQYESIYATCYDVSSMEIIKQGRIYLNGSQYR